MYDLEVKPVAMDLGYATDFASNKNIISEAKSAALLNLNVE
jgi:hypothetical protein